MSKKFTQLEEVDFLSRLKPFIVSILALSGILNILLYLLGWYVSRVIAFGSIGLFFIFELLVFSVSYFYSTFRDGEKKEKRLWFPAVFFLVEFSLLLLSFWTVHYLKERDFNLHDTDIMFLMGATALWLVSSFVVHQFDIQKRSNYFKTLFPFLKSEVIVIGTVSMIILMGNFIFLSRTIVMGTLLLYSFLEILVVTGYYISTGDPITDMPDISLFNVDQRDRDPLLLDELEDVYDEDNTKLYQYPGSTLQTTFFRRKMQNTFLSKFPKVHEFIESRIDMEKLDILKSVMIYSSTPYNIEILEDDSLQFFGNLRQLNDFRTINKNLKLVNSKMHMGGILLGKFNNLAQTRNRFYKRLPFALARGFYPFFFFYKRVCPKIPVLKKIYFALSKGRMRSISSAEALGRLYFCGFEIMDLREIDNFTWFIAKKIKVPSQDKKPSYGLLFKQRRVGKNGDFIYIYKMRTMYPYSEYIHTFVLNYLKLDESGKVRNDFRITNWGRVFRKLWIDELPMLINWMKRELKLVGVRPLSKSFYDTYPDELKIQRVKSKPGLVPPYYADMPNSMEEVWASERRYLERYEKHPLLTDIAYFFKAFKNILFNHAKSG